MKKYGFGVDLGGTTVKMGLFETDGKLLDKWEIKTNTENNGESILGDIAKAIDDKLVEKSISKDDVQGVGIDVPGPVTGKGIVNKCVNLGWGVKDVVQELGDLTGLMVKVGNDANIAALGEMWQGAGKGCDNVVMVTLGTGVGGGIIVDGKVVAGAHGAGGEIGHIKVSDNETEKCGCGKCGCLEQYASATGIVRVAKKRLAASDEKTSLRNFQELTAKDIFDEAKANDAVAVSIVEEVMKMLGEAIANISAVVDPEVVVIGGGVSKAGSIITDTVAKYFEAAAFHACRGTKFVIAELGNDAGIYGGIKLIID